MNKDDDYKKAREYALRSLAMCEQTEHQLRTKMINKEYDIAVIDDTIQYLKQLDYLNDARFIEQYIACHCHKMNRKQILEKLYSKGVYGVNIDSILEDNQYDERSLLRRDYEKYMKNRDKNDPKIREKLVQHLLRKGYSYGDIRNMETT